MSVFRKPAVPVAPPAPNNSPLTTAFDQQHLRLLTDKLSETTGELRSANERLRAIIDIGLELASERGGNCELTRVGETVKEYGVSIIGAINLASSVPYHASQMYARNLATFLVYIVKEGKLQLNLQDEIIRETMVTHAGEIVNARVREFFKLPALVSQ